MKYLPLFAALPIAAFAQDGGQSGGGYQMLVLIGLMLVFFYFILWRPEQKRRKAAEQMRSGLKKGDRVTAMGIVGRIVRVKEQTIVIDTEGSKVEVLKAAITDSQSGGPEEAEASKD